MKDSQASLRPSASLSLLLKNNHLHFLLVGCIQRQIGQGLQGRESDRALRVYDQVLEPHDAASLPKAVLVGGKGCAVGDGD